MSKSPGSNDVICEHTGSAGSIALITLNRPDRANAMTPSMAEELAGVLQRALDDTAVKAIVLTGMGKHFCPGLDAEHARSLAERIASGVHPAEPYDGNLRHLHNVTRLIFECRKPVIAAVNGAAAAGGLDLIAACDYRLSSSTGRFSESYIKLGLPPLNGGAWLLPRLIGSSAAFRMVMTGEVLDADAALKIGLVDEIHPADQLLQKAISFAESVSAAPAAVVAFTKRELQARGSLEDALSRVFVAGIAFSRSREFRSGSDKMPGRQVSSSSGK